MHRRSLILWSILLLVVLAGCGGRTGRAESEEPGAPQSGAPQPAPEQAASGEQAGGAAAESPSAGVSFATQVAPIFAGSCNYCHHPDNAVKVDLTRPFDPDVGIIERPNSWTRSTRKILVVPGDPGASALIWKVEQVELEPKIDGDPMPWNIPPLTNQELESLRGWILQGAQEDSLYRSSITRIFGDGVSLGSRGGKCAYCHYAGASFGPDLTDPFDAQRGSVGISSDFGGIRIVSGDPQASVLFLKVGGGTLPPELGQPMPLHFPRLQPEQIGVLRQWIAEGAKNN